MRHDDAECAAQRRLGADEVDPPVVELAVDEDELAGHVAGGVELVGRALTDVDELGAVTGPSVPGTPANDEAMIVLSPTLTQAPLKSQASTGTASRCTSARPMSRSWSAT